MKKFIIVFLIVLTSIFIRKTLINNTNSSCQIIKGECDLINQ